MNEFSEEFILSTHGFPVCGVSAVVLFSSLSDCCCECNRAWSCRRSTTGGRASGGVRSRLRLRGVGQPSSYLEGTQNYEKHSDQAGYIFRVDRAASVPRISDTTSSESEYGHGHRYITASADAMNGMLVQWDESNETQQ